MSGAPWHPKYPHGCLACGTTARPHDGRGMCKRCWNRDRYGYNASGPTPDYRASRESRSPHAAVTERAISRHKARIVERIARHRRDPWPSLREERAA